MGTMHKHGYLYDLSIGAKLNAECEKAKDGIRRIQTARNVRELEEFDWHAMRKFADTMDHGN